MVGCLVSYWDGIPFWVPHPWQWMEGFPWVFTSHIWLTWCFCCVVTRLGSCNICYISYVCVVYNHPPNVYTGHPVTLWSKSAAPEEGAINGWNTTTVWDIFIQPTSIHHQHSNGHGGLLSIHHSLPTPEMVMVDCAYMITCPPLRS